MKKAQKEKKPLTKKQLREHLEKFTVLDYAGKLQYMDEHFRGFSVWGNEVNKPPEFSVMPTTPEEIRMYNEWKIKLFYKVLHPDFRPSPDGPIWDEQFIDYSFEWLRERYTKTIRGIRRENAYPDTLITQYTNAQISEYEDKARKCETIFKEYNGVWDLSLKVIADYPQLLRARAVYNYVGYLKQLEFKPSPAKLPVIPPAILKKAYREFNRILWKDITLEKYLDLFDPANTKPGKLRYTKNGYQVLIAYLFKQICLIKGLPFTNLEARVGSFDRTDFDKDHKPQKAEMFDAIEFFLDKMKKGKM